MPIEVEECGAAQLTVLQRVDKPAAELLQRMLARPAPADQAGAAPREGPRALVGCTGETGVPDDFGSRFWNVTSFSAASSSLSTAP